MTRGVERLNDHVVLCGYGRNGQVLAQELAREQLEFVVVELEPDRVQEAKENRLLVVAGNATEEDVLVAAGVKRASAVIMSLPNDAANVFITLTSRNLNPGLRIIARAEHRSSEKKLEQADADRVVMPAVIGAQRMARMLVRPATAEVIELFGDAGDMQMEMDELTIREQSGLVGKTVAEAETHRLHRLLIVMVKQVEGTMVFNPSADYLFRVQDTLVVMGRLEDISRFQQEYSI